MTNTASISNQSTNNSLGFFYGKVWCQSKYYSSQHQTLFSLPDTSTTGHHFHFGSAVSFFLELFIIDLCSPLVAHWTPSNLRGSYSSVKNFAFSLCPWNSPSKNTGVSCHFLLQGIFWIHGSNPALPHCRQILYHLSHRESQKEYLGQKSAEGAINIHLLVPQSPFQM